MREVVIVATGTANLASVRAAFERLGTEAFVEDDPHKVEHADFVMLPGVGAFGASMKRLVQHRLDQALRTRIKARRPTMAICVGHQLLFESSDETPTARGLGVVPGHVGRFPETVRVPQFGWNRVIPEEGCKLLEDGYAYFANSFRITQAPECGIARAGHGGPFVAALERGNLLGCQFHPELSGDYGMALMQRWLELG
ncbi:MAG: imidazole glycerol phosphate synthase subunit HisH [Pseudomonadota bacterium]